MTTTPDPVPPSGAIEAAVAAAAGAVSITALEPGPVLTAGPGGDHPCPEDDPVYASLSVHGALEGTITLAVGDEIEQRLEYAADADGPAGALAALADAAVEALRELGELEATPLAEVGTDAWPGEGPVVASAGLLDGGETVLALAFSLTVQSQPGDGADPAEPWGGAIAAPGSSAMSTSGDERSASVPPAHPLGGTQRIAGEVARLADVEVEVSGVLGESVVALHDLLGWLPGVIVPLDRDVGAPVDVRIHDVTVAHGDVVVVDEHYGLRVVDVVAGARARAAATHLRPAPGIS